MTAISLQTPCWELPRRSSGVVAPARPERVRAGARERAGGAAPLHITRRGRLVLAMLVGLMLALGVASFSHALTETFPAVGSASDMGTTEEVVVLPGDTLWSIASAGSPEGDVRDIIVEIRELNDLESSGVMAGQRLLVPTG